MTAANILIYVGLIVYIVLRRIQGQPVKAPRKLFVLPLVLIVLGYLDITQGAGLKSLEIALTVIAGILSLGLGVLRGRSDKLSDRDGALFMQWGTASVTLFATNIAAKIALDLIAVAAGGNSSAVGKSLILTFGLTLLGEAFVIGMRAGGTTRLLTPRRSVGAGSRPTSTARSAASPVSAQDDVDRLAQPVDRPVGFGVTAPTGTSGVTGAIRAHHERHEARHQHRHGRNES